VVHTLSMLGMKQSMESEGVMTLFSAAYVSGFIVVHWPHDGNFDGCKTCLISETPSPAHVCIGFKEYCSTVQWITL